MAIKIVLLAIGGLLGYLFRKHVKLSKRINDLAFYFFLPIMVLIEFSSMELKEWYYFPLGSIFVFALFYLARIIGLDRHKAALLATAEGGTVGFVIYILAGTEPISRFLLIDMLGNGIILFSFVYYQLSNRYDIKSFFLNPLVLASFTGIALNLFGVKLKTWMLIPNVETTVVYILIVLLSWIIFSGIKKSLSKEILTSKFFKYFWSIRLTGACLGLFFHWPLALTILFILPPSFLLPVIYRDVKDESYRSYAINFIAACLPVFILVSVFFLSYYVWLYEIGL